MVLRRNKSFNAGARFILSTSLRNGAKSGDTATPASDQIAPRLPRYGPGDAVYRPFLASATVFPIRTPLGV